MQSIAAEDRSITAEMRRPAENSQAVQSSRYADRFTLVFATALLTVLFAATIRWSLGHPYGVHWDEAQYFNDALIDVHRLQSGMLVRFAGRILIRTWGRPPAYRVLADPILAIVGFRTFTARLITMACFWLSTWLVYLSVKRLASRTAGAFAALIFALSPEVVSASVFFGTDATVYLATAAMLYFLIENWSGSAKQPGNWIGLGLAIGFGFLAKTSFFAIAVPVIVFWLVGSRWRKTGISIGAAEWKAAALAFVIAGPWWVLNLKAAFDYGKYARAFVRNSLGTPSLATSVRWLSSVVQCLWGYGIAILIVLVSVAYVLYVLRKKGSGLSLLQQNAVIACACAGLPIVCAQLSGTNHLLRHISPAMIPLAITFGIAFDRIGWAHSRAALAFFCLLFGIQLGMLIAPVISPNDHPVDLGFANGAVPWRTLVRFDQWDWTPVRALAESCGLRTPQIAYLGNGRGFNKPEIAYFWVVRDASFRGVMIDAPDPTWLWRYENGPIDWAHLMAITDRSDVVLTAPHLVGEPRYGEDLDNQYNADFADKLSHDPNFRPPVSIEMGRFTPVEVLVYLNRNLTCSAGEATPAAQ